MVQNAHERASNKLQQYTTSVQWTVMLSWLQHAYSRILFSAGNFDP